MTWTGNFSLQLTFVTLVQGTSLNLLIQFKRNPWESEPSYLTWVRSMPVWYESANSARRRRKNIQKSLNLSHIWLSTELVLRWLRWLFWYCWMRVKFWLVDELKILFEDQIFWGPWFYKGARNKLKLLIVSDIIQTFHIHTNNICRQLKKGFFQVGPGEMFGWCQKSFFSTQNSNRSKQTTAKCKQIEKNKSLSFIIVSYSYTCNWFNKLITAVCPHQFPPIYFLSRKKNCDLT